MHTCNMGMDIDNGMGMGMGMGKLVSNHKEAGVSSGHYSWNASSLIIFMYHVSFLFFLLPGDWYNLTSWVLLIPEYEE